MSLIKAALWESTIPGPMPEGCTFQMYRAACNQLLEQEWLDMATEELTHVTAMLEKELSENVRQYFTQRQQELIVQIHESS